VALSDQQRAALEAEAKRRGVDPAKLIAAAEAQSSGGVAAPAPKAPTGPTATKNENPLYQYHLPFVTVNEVRQGWLGLGPMDGGEENAAKYAARMLAGETTKPEPAA
jgi:hypothetical protein